MIKVKRNVPIPLSLDGRKSKGGKETARAVRHFHKKTSRDTPFKSYRAYGGDDVKQALNLLFNYKCAYCEIDYGGAPMDVEHFRPKGAVVEFDTTTLCPRQPLLKYVPGYYWLAAEWDNLLPACQDCNRPRKHSFQGAVDAVTGKANLFPVAASTHRARFGQSCEALESRLLLDPTRDDPAKHLEYADHGVIRARRTRQGPDLKGTVSIEVFGLQREALVRKREERQSMLKARILQIADDLERLAIDPQDHRSDASLKRTLDEIESKHLGPSRPFLAMSRQIVARDLLPRLFGTKYWARAKLLPMR